MAYPQGIAFRQTTGFVTDAANYDPEVSPFGDPTYPNTTAQGNNVGWETAVPSNNYDSRDQNAGNDPRIAGTMYPSGTGFDVDYRLDLTSSGNYNIGIAMGDAAYSRDSVCSLFDTSSSLGSLTTGTTSAGQRYKDATNTEYTNVTWPTSQTLVSKTFTTTICRFRVGDNSRISSLWVEAGAAPPGGGTPIIQRILRSNLIWR